MANFYLDVSAIGNEYQAYADTPTTWAMPQDGNGKAGPGHSAAVAIGTIDCASASCSGAGQLLVLGASVSSTLTGSGSTLATNIAAAINGSGTAVTSTYSALLLPINRLVYARVHPTINTTVQIMLRIAGADWNGMTHTTAGTWGTVPTMGAFAGGADGPFAYFVNNSIIFGKAVFTGGVYAAKSAGVTDPAATGFDPIHVRTMRSGVSLACALTSTTGSIQPSMPTGVSRTFIFDNGTTWSGDNGVFFISMINTTSNYVNIGLMLAAYTTLNMIARSKYGLKVSWAANSTGYDWAIVNGSAGTANYVNAEFAAINAYATVSLTAGYTATINLVGCKFDLLKNAVILAQYGQSPTNANVVDCDFNYSISANLTNLMSLGTATYSVRLDGCRFVVDGGLNSIAAITSMGTAFGLLVIENCTGIPNKIAGVAASSSQFYGQYYWSGKEEGRSFRYESAPMVLDWDGSGVYPTYTATTPEGAPYGVRISWSATRVGTKWATPIARLVTVHADAPAARTFTLEFLVNTTVTGEIPTKAQLFCVCKYTGNDGARYTITDSEPMAFHNAGLATVRDTGVGTSAWTLNGVTGTSSIQIAVTTPNAVKSMSRVEMTLYFGGPPATDKLVYLNPEILVV